METLLLVPGLLCDEAIWMPQVQALAGKYDVRIPVLSNFDSIEAMARSILGSAPPRFALAGHSMGARVALEIMRLSPERISRLALLDTGTNNAKEGEFAGHLALTKLSRTRGMGALAEVWLPQRVAPGNLHGTLEATLVDMVKRMTPEIHARQMAALLGRPDATPGLSRIHVPTLVGVGSEDTWNPPEQNRQIAEAIPSAEFIFFEGSGHMSPLEAPEAVTAAITEWMARSGNYKTPAYLSLQKRTQIEALCTRMINKFAWLNDAQDYAALAEMFTEDGSFARPSAPLSPVRGRDALRAFFKDRPRRVTQHVMTNIVVDVESENHASARSYVTLYSGDGGKNVAVGHFHDRLLRDDDGVWRFQERKGSLTFS